jgi:hypothetical protein
MANRPLPHTAPLDTKEPTPGSAASPAPRQKNRATGVLSRAFVQIVREKHSHSDQSIRLYWTIVRSWMIDHDTPNRSRSWLKRVAKKVSASGA